MIKTAQELTDFSKGEESLLEKQIKDIADTGAKVVVSGGKIGDLALHYLNKYGLMGVRLTSKWDVRRLCRAVNATPLPKITPPTAEELGYADTVHIDELVRHCSNILTIDHFNFCASFLGENIIFMFLFRVILP